MGSQIDVCPNRRGRVYDIMTISDEYCTLRGDCDCENCPEAHPEREGWTKRDCQYYKAPFIVESINSIGYINEQSYRGPPQNREINTEIPILWQDLVGADWDENGHLHTVRVRREGELVFIPEEDFEPGSQTLDELTADVRRAMVGSPAEGGIGGEAARAMVEEYPHPNHFADALGHSTGHRNVLQLQEEGTMEIVFVNVNGEMQMFHNGERITGVEFRAETTRDDYFFTTENGREILYTRHHGTTRWVGYNPRALRIIHEFPIINWLRVLFGVKMKVNLEYSIYL